MSKKMNQLWSVMDLLSPFLREEKKATVRKLKVLLFMLKEGESDKPTLEAMLGVGAGNVVKSLLEQLERDDGLIETFVSGKRTAAVLSDKGKTLKVLVEEALSKSGG